MACDLRCPECGDNFGKDIENPLMAWCGDCGIDIYNVRGEKDGSEEEKEFIRKQRPKARFLPNGRMLTSRITNINKR